MIKCIDIKNCGVFRDFEWKSLLREKRIPEQFKRLNILYGRNYSGKTTLSRIVRSLDTGKLPSKYDKPQFAISFSERANSVVVTQENLQEHGYTVRVYNRDFVEEVFSFETSSAASFAVVGTVNVEHKKRIEQLEQELGDPETEGGWRYRLRQAESRLEQLRVACSPFSDPDGMRVSMALRAQGETRCRNDESGTAPSRSSGSCEMPMPC